MQLDAETKQTIESTIQDNKVVLYEGHSGYASVWF